MPSFKKKKKSVYDVGAEYVDVCGICQNLKSLFIFLPYILYMRNT